MAFFCTFLTTAWPQPGAVRSIRGEPGSAANHQAFASPCCLAFPQGLHDPHLRRVGFRVSKTTHAACRLPAWAVQGPAYYSELPKTLRTVPTYSVYGRIARLLRAPLESALPAHGEIARPQAVDRSGACSVSHESERASTEISPLPILPKT